MARSSHTTLVTGLLAGIAIAMPAAAQADDLSAITTGDRTASNAVPGFSAGIGGAGFEYTQSEALANDPASTGWTPMPGATDGSGRQTVNVPGSAAAPQDYFVRQSSVPEGYRNFGPVKALAYDPDNPAPTALRPFVSKARVGGAATTASPNPSGNTWTTSMPGGSGLPFVAVRDNSRFPADCGLNVLLVLDRSISVKPRRATFEAAAKSLVDALSGTPTQVAIQSFDTTANSYHNLSGNQAMTRSPMPLDDAGQTNENILKQTISNVYAAPGGSTDWDLALHNAAAAGWFSPRADTGQTQSPDVVVFVTDGNPTFNQTATPGDGASVDLANVVAGISSANLVKQRIARGNTTTKLFAIGVSDPATADSINTENLKVVSGRERGEDYDTPTVDQLRAKLTEVAARSCGARVFVRKRINGENGDQAGWKFSAASDGGQLTALDNDRATHQTGDGIRTGALLTQLPTTGATVAISEDTTGQPAAATVVGKECRSGSFSGAVVATGSPTANALTVPVTRGSDLYCTFTNERTPSAPAPAPATAPEAPAPAATLGEPEPGVLPAPTRAAGRPPACTKVPLALTDVHWLNTAGRTVAVEGVYLNGSDRKVRLSVNKRFSKTVKVDGAGQFRTTVRVTPAEMALFRRHPNEVRVVARAARGGATKRLKIVRKLYNEKLELKGRTITMSGRLDRSVKPGSVMTVRLSQKSSCDGRGKWIKTKVKARLVGRTLTVKFPKPAGPVRADGTITKFYRVEILVNWAGKRGTYDRRPFRTYTLPRRIVMH